jgi:hypothetical protein
VEEETVEDVRNVAGGTLRTWDVRSLDGATHPVVDSSG